MIDNWKKQLGNGEKVGVIFMELPKAFDTINNLLSAKLKAYGFSEETLSLLQSLLCNRFQITLINSSFSRKNEVIAGLPQGSTLGSLLFNKFLNDVFLFISILSTM